MRRATSLALFVHRLNAISIHALHEESDDIDQQLLYDNYISIHALHEESDRARVHLPSSNRRDFNPRSP